MADYATVASKLALVRRAWKRTAALSGLAIVALEAVGLLTVAVLIDVLYRPLPAVRVALFAVVVAVVFVMAMRHVLGPLRRAIPDEQVALYVEEHSPSFEGALVAAAEFREGHWLSDQQAMLVDAIIREAAQRAEQIDLRTVLDFSRLRKYGVAAMVVVAAYVGAGVLFPRSVGKHAARVLRPWQETEEDRAFVERVRRERLPITFMLSQGDASILRGSPFELEVELSRESSYPVLLHFRAAAPGGKSRWRTLPMKGIEKLNGYRAQLADVNEDMEYYVSTAKFESSPHTITVYDPLVLEGVEVTTRYPSYLKLPDRVEVQSGGDATAPIGAAVTVRVLTNRPLEGGSLTWDNGATVPLEPVADKPRSAAASFTVETDRSFTFTVRGVMGQEAASAGPSFVRAIEDAPPTLELRHPTDALFIHPLGEVTFLADAADDFGIDKVELVTLRGLEEKPDETRLPFDLTRLEQARYTPGGSVRASLHFRLEDVTPRLKPEESVAWYIECSDRKGQKAISDIYLITVKHFETWATWESLPAEELLAAGQDLEPFFKAAWHLHTQRQQLNEADFRRQCHELADSMIDPETNTLYTFAFTENPDKTEAMHKANALIEKGHKALGEADTQTTVDAWRVALALIATFDLAPDQPQVVPEGGVSPAGTPRDSQLEVAAIEAARMEQEMELAAPQDGAVSDAERARENAQDARSLEREQEDVVNKAHQLAEDQGQGGPEAEPPGEEARDLADRQDGVAEKAKQVAQAVKQDALAQDDPTAREAATKLDRAAAEMQRAARQLREGRVEHAVAQAERAQDTLREAAEELGGVEQAKLERALDDAEARAEQLRDRQRALRGKTERVAERRKGEPTPQQQRDLKVAGVQQARLRAEAGQLERDIEQIRTWAEKGARPETAKAVERAAHQMRRGRVKQKMANAVVELAATQAAQAAAEQKEAEEALDRTLEGVRAANDTLASDIQSELRRARNEARRIEKDVAELAPKGQEREGQPEKPPTMTPREREAKGERLAYDIRRFAKHVENRDFAPPDEMRPLKQAAERPQALGRELRREPEKHRALLEATRRLRNKLEEAYQSSLEARKLFAAQREECPPQYRHLVNEYYEALSKR
ncbi:MAG: hypothetical protein ACODAJ_01035 [Planctomycetota bacterium]